MFIHLHIVYGHFCAATAESSSCGRGYRVCKAEHIYSQAVYKKKSLLISAVEDSHLNNVGPSFAAALVIALIKGFPLGLPMEHSQLVSFSILGGISSFLSL